MSLKNEFIKIAESQIGKEETPRGSNWGEPVISYLKSVHIDFPASWCMAFIYWCFDKACKSLKQLNYLPKSGGVLNVWNKTEAKYKSNLPSIGAIFIMDHGRGLGHTGVVTRFDVRFIYTIEGNTNDDGSREGYEVAMRKRLRSTIKGYIKVD